jgi:hypothetical protein
MLNQPLMEKLLAMRLQGMVEALKAQEQDRAIHELSFWNDSRYSSTSNGAGVRTRRWRED